jgi:signal transduction histidine kinase
LTRLTVRARVVIALLIALVGGYFYLTWSFYIGVDIVRAYRDQVPYACSTPSNPFNLGCDSVNGSTTWAWIWLGTAGLLVLVAGFGLIRWALRPVVAVTRSLNRMGPQNLGERNDFPVSRDEVSQLAEAVDAMLDRVAEGYEGQRRFAANASHELRTPLAVQRTLIEVGLSEAGGPATADQLELLARQLLHANERNEALIEGLLVLAETDRGLVSRTAQALDRIVAEAVSSYRATASAAEIEVVAELEPVAVAGELPLLERLVANLVGNALKYNVAGGSVRVRLQARPPTLTVANTGPVVPPESVGQLFEPFRRINTDRMNHAGGSGLGLTIVRSIVQAHNGHVQAQANADGGLTVTVQLPPA